MPLSNLKISDTVRIQQTIMNSTCILRMDVLYIITRTTIIKSSIIHETCPSIICEVAMPLTIALISHEKFKTIAITGSPLVLFFIVYRINSTYVIVQNMIWRLSKLPAIIHNYTYYYFQAKTHKSADENTHPAGFCVFNPGGSSRPGQHYSRLLLSTTARFSLRSSVTS